MSHSQGVPGRITVDQNQAWSLSNGWKSISCYPSTQSPPKALISLIVKAKPSDQPISLTSVPSPHLSASSPMIPLANSTPHSSFLVFQQTPVAELWLLLCLLHGTLFPYIGAQLTFHLSLRPLLRCSLPS